MTKTELAEALKAAGIDLTASQIKKATVEDLKARLDATKAKKPAPTYVMRTITFSK